MTSIPTERWIEGMIVGDGCWEHANVPDKGNGYRRLVINKRTRLAHRVIYEWLVGPISEGLQIDHLCRNRGCLNPSHMEAVSQKENILRGTSPPAMNAQKTHCVNGHLMDEKNSRPVRGGRGRRCRACHRESVKASNLRSTHTEREER